MKRLSVLLLALSVMLLVAPAANAEPPGQTTGTAPEILEFTTPLSNVNRNALIQRTARVPVAWDTTNRPFIANLVFDQVLPDGSALNVELPRPLPWVASTGQGMAAPIMPEGDATEIVLRMRMVNMLTREVYDEATITLPIDASGAGTAPDIGDRATITSFTTTSTFVNRAQLSDGSARVPVSWNVANRPVTSNLYFEQVLPDGSAVNVELPRENPWVNSSGIGVAAPQLPDGDVETILLRVRLIDLLDGRLYDQQMFTLPIIEGDSLPPAITSFTAGATSVDVNQLALRTARIPVSWAVESRPDDTNLVFEQVFADGRAVNVELPRPNPWVPSSGNGVAAPVLEPGATNVTLRVRLINWTTKATLLQRELTLPINGNTNNVPSYVVDPAWCYTEPFRPSNGLTVGKRGYVTDLVPSEGLRLFSSQYGSGIPLGFVAAESAVDVLEGPFCYRLNFATNNQSVFRLWRVRSIAQPNLEGWANEYVSTVSGMFWNLTGTAPGTTEEEDTGEEGEESNGETDEEGEGQNGEPDEGDGEGEEVALSIDELSASPDPVQVDDYLTITWATTGASFVGLNLLDGPGGALVQPIVPPGQMALSGSMAYAIPEDAQDSITLALVVSDADGREVTREVTVAIAECAFDETLTDFCPATQLEVPAALQSFEGGYMIWRGDTNTIFVLYGDDSSWVTYPDTWVEGEAVDTGEPPAGNFAPVRGFGKVWVEQTLSERLGWAMANEQGYTATIEEYQADGNFPSLGISLPGDSVVLLGEDWRIFP